MVTVRILRDAPRHAAERRCVVVFCHPVPHITGWVKAFS